jgi:hypothetical protein
MRPPAAINAHDNAVALFKIRFVRLAGTARNRAAFRRERALPLEIALVRRPPIRQCAVTFAFTKGKPFVDLAEPPLNQLHCFKNRPRDSRFVKHHHALPHTRDGSIADGPTRGALSSGQDQVGEFVSQRWAISE